MIILGLGTNIGDRRKNLEKAIVQISQNLLTNLEQSEIYETQAMLKENSPKSWNKPFLNMAVKGDCNISPFKVLEKIKQIETLLGREKIHEVWSPRIIDIDIIAIDDICINTKELTVPHKLTCQRDFVLKPLCDIAPDWTYPIKESKNYMKSAKDILINL